MVRIVPVRPPSGGSHRGDAEHREAAGLQRPLGLTGGRSRREDVVADHREPTVDVGPAGAAARRAVHRAGQVGGPRGGVQTSLVLHPPDTQQPGDPGVVPPGRRVAPAAAVRAYVGSWPRARTVAARDGTGTRTSGTAGTATARRQPARPPHRRAARRAGGAGPAGRAPCGRAPGRAAGRRTPPPPSSRPAPAGTGVGRTGPRCRGASSAQRRRAAARVAAAGAGGAGQQVDEGCEHRSSHARRGRSATATGPACGRERQPTYVRASIC